MKPINNESSRLHNRRSRPHCTVRLCSQIASNKPPVQSPSSRDLADSICIISTHSAIYRLIQSAVSPRRTGTGAKENSARMRARDGQPDTFPPSRPSSACVTRLAALTTHFRLFKTDNSVARERRAPFLPSPSRLSR